MSSSFLKPTMQFIVTEILKTIYPSDIFLGRFPLAFYLYPCLPSSVVEILLERISRNNPNAAPYVAKLFSKTSKNLYVVSNPKVANLVEWAQSYIQMNIRSNKHRFLWSILALSEVYKTTSSCVQIPLHEVLRIGYLRLKHNGITEMLDEINKELKDFTLEQFPSLREVIKINKTDQVYKKTVNIFKDLKQLVPTIELKDDDIIVHDLQQLELLMIGYARIAYMKMKYIKHVMNVLCNVGPCSKNELLEIVSQWYGFKKESVRVKHYYIAKKYDFIKEEKIGRETLIVPNCNKCIYYAEPGLCRKKSLEIFKNFKMEVPSKLPNYILRPFALKVMQILENIEEIERLSIITNNKALIDILEQIISFK